MFTTRNSLQRQLQEVVSKSRNDVDSILTSLDREGVFLELQDTFDRMNSILKKAQSKDQKRIIQVLAKAITDSLRDRGFPEETVEYVERKIIDTWVTLLERGASVDIRGVFSRLMEDWKGIEEHMEKRWDETEARTYFSGIKRINTGGGLVVFDGAKFLLVSAPSAFMLSSFLGGAVFFSMGLDDIW